MASGSEKKEGKLCGKDCGCRPSGVVWSEVFVAIAEAEE